MDGALDDRWAMAAGTERVRRSRGWEDRESVRTSPRLRRGVALGAQPALGFVRPMVLLIDMSAIAPAGTAEARGGPGPGRCFTV